MGLSSRIITGTNQYLLGNNVKKGGLCKGAAFLRFETDLLFRAFRKINPV
jgi:hypothetical protein